MIVVHAVNRDALIAAGADPDRDFNKTTCIVQSCQGQWCPGGRDKKGQKSYAYKMVDAVTAYEFQVGKTLLKFSVGQEISCWKNADSSWSDALEEVYECQNEPLCYKVIFPGQIIEDKIGAHNGNIKIGSTFLSFYLFGFLCICLRACMHKRHLNEPDAIKNEEAKSAEEEEYEDEEENEERLKMKRHKLAMVAKPEDTESYFVDNLGAGPEITLCVVCQDAQRSIVFSPCKHFCVCKSCSDKMKKNASDCPICRKQINKREAVFMV